MLNEWTRPKAGKSGISSPAPEPLAGGSGTGKWSVSARSVGEVLTTDIRSDGLRLMLFAPPSDETARQIEARLEELLAPDPASETRYSGVGAVPAALQHAADVLLELVGDVERATRRHAGALALYQSAREVACAYIGGGEPDVWSHGQRYDPPWVALRDGAAGVDGVPVARGFAVFAREDLDMRLRWPYLLGTPRPEGVVVDARWRAPKGFEITVRELSRGDLPGQHHDDAEIDATPAVINDEGRGEFFLGWFDDLGRGTDVQPQRPIPPLPGDAAIITPPAAPRGRPVIAFPDLVEELRGQAEHAALADAMVAPTGEPFEAPAGIASTHEPASPDGGAETADGVEDFAAPARSVRRPQWPVFVEPRGRRMMWKRQGRWAAVVAVLFALGWWLGTRDGEPTGIHGGHAPLAVQLLRAVGLASPRFTARIRSTPPGAMIVIDGKPSAYRTPAEIELAPGIRRIGLALPDLGTLTTVVEGRRGGRVPIDVPLTGTLLVSAPDPSTPVAITLDGEERGFAPLEVKAIAPGPHDLTYTSPGQPPWSQTIMVPLRGNVRIVARPFDLPAAGVIHVGATWTSDEGSRDLRGASVTIDGERRGSTPLTLDLPRGPHSLRAQYHGEELPIQVIDLPGGNERFLSFSFGTGAVFPKLLLQSPLEGVSPDVPTPVSVALQGLSVRDVREAWLHVRAPDASWRRYPMTVLSADAQPVARVVFPSALLDDRGDAPFYVSALVSTGEEYFTDIYGAAPRASSRLARKAAPPSPATARPAPPDAPRTPSTP